MRGVFGLRRAPIHSLWSGEFGLNFIKKRMTRDRFCEILRFLRFDNCASRRQRVINDKFAHVREIFEEFTTNSIQVKYIAINSSLS